MLTEELQGVDESVAGEDHVEPPVPGVLAPVLAHGPLQPPPLGEAGYKDCGTQQEAHGHVQDGAVLPQYVDRSQ